MIISSISELTRRCVSLRCSVGQIYMKRLLILPMFVAACALTAAAQTTYYVDENDPGASNANTGSSASPLVTIGECENRMTAGDTCIVKNTGGTYSGFSTNTSGSPGNYITYRAQPGGTQPSITGDVDFGSSSYVVVDGFHMNSASFNGNGCDFITMQNNLIDKSGTGITEVEDCDDVLISGNTFERITDDAINQWGRRWTIRDNIVVDQAACCGYHMDFWQSYCNGGSVPSRVPADYTLFENNLYANVSGGDTHFFFFHQTSSCGSDMGTNFIIRHNKVRKVGSSGVTFQDNSSPGFRGLAIYNNTFIELYDGSPDSWQDYIGIVDSAVGTKFFYNNLLYDTVDPVGSEGIYPSNNVSGCTLAYDSSSSISIDGALANDANRIVNQNPDLNDYANDDFTLAATSPAIDAGCPLTSVATADSGSGTSLTVDDPWLFSPGWGGADGDCVAVGTLSNTTCITSINYDTGVLTIASAISRNDGDNVWLYSDSNGTVVLKGSAPDIGAEESGPTAPDTTPPTISELFPNN